jgi:hypothetical protein
VRPDDRVEIGFSYPGKDVLGEQRAADQHGAAVVQPVDRNTVRRLGGGIVGRSGDRRAWNQEYCECEHAFRTLHG